MYLYLEVGEEGLEQLPLARAKQAVERGVELRLHRVEVEGAGLQCKWKWRWRWRGRAPTPSCRGGGVARGGHVRMSGATPHFSHDHSRQKDQCHAATTHHTSPHHAAPRHATRRRTAPRHAAPRHATSCHATPRHIAPRHTAPRHATPSTPPAHANNNQYTYQ